MTPYSAAMRPTPYPDIEAFAEDLRRQEASAYTVKSYRSDLAGFAVWFETSNGEAFAAAGVTPTDVRSYKSHQQAVMQRKPRTINRRLACLKRFFQWAKAAGQITENPAAAVTLVPHMPSPPRSLTRQQLNQLTRAVERSGNKRDIAILTTFRYTGIRVGELCALKRTDLEISERKGMLTVRSGKGGKFRQVPLNAEVRRALDAYLEVRRATDDELVFIGQRGALKEQAVQLVVKKYARQAGLEDVTAHVLRHSFGKQAIEAGIGLETVAALLGHEKLDTTRIYTQPHLSDLEAAVEMLGVG